MDCKIEFLDVELICGIVGEGAEHRLSKDCGAGGKTVFPGRKMVERSPLLDLFGLADEKQDVVLMLADRKRAREVFDRVARRLEEDETSGILFSTPVSKVVGTRTCIGNPNNAEVSEETSMYSLMTVVVERGNAEKPIEIANAKGAVCVTIVNGRGAGIHETSKVFAMEIEPEKEIVLIVAETAKVDDMVAAIREELDMDKPGNGLVFLQEITRIYGV